MEGRHGSSQCKESKNNQNEEKNGHVTPQGDSELNEVFRGADCYSDNLKILEKNDETEYVIPTINILHTIH